MNVRKIDSLLYFDDLAAGVGKRRYGCGARGRNGDPKFCVREQLVVGLKRGWAAHFMESNMNEMRATNEDNRDAVNIPPALLMAEPVSPVIVGGEYDQSTGTWSNRDFECASSKKHNEDM